MSKTQNAVTVKKECPNCFTVYLVPEKSGCTICPKCGQRDCNA